MTSEEIDAAVKDFMRRLEEAEPKTKKKRDWSFYFIVFIVAVVFFVLGSLTRW